MDRANAARQWHNQDEFRLHGLEVPLQEGRPGQARHGAQSAEQRIENALRIVAELLEQDDSYLPIFLRLEAELKKVDARSAALNRARAYLGAGRQMAIRDSSPDLKASPPA